MRREVRRERRRVRNEKDEQGGSGGRVRTAQHRDNKLHFSK